MTFLDNLKALITVSKNYMPITALAVKKSSEVEFCVMEEICE
jgi:hypothetical protein